MLRQGPALDPHDRPHGLWGGWLAGRPLSLQEQSTVWHAQGEGLGEPVGSRQDGATVTSGRCRSICVSPKDDPTPAPSSHTVADLEGGLCRSREAKRRLCAEAGPASAMVVSF